MVGHNLVYNHFLNFSRDGSKMPCTGNHFSWRIKFTLEGGVNTAPLGKRNHLDACQRPERNGSSDELQQIGGYRLCSNLEREEFRQVKTPKGTSHDEHKKKLYAETEDLAHDSDRLRRIVNRTVRRRPDDCFWGLRLKEVRMISCRRPFKCFRMRYNCFY